MANIIKAGNSAGGFAVTPDNTGALEIKTGAAAGGTTAIAIDASQNVTFANNSTVTGNLAVTGTVTATGGVSGAAGLGVGQTWTNVSASRAYSTTYTNSTGKPIMVSVFSSTPAASAAVCSFFVNGAFVGGFGMSQSGGISNGNTFIVPAGSTYSVTATNFNAPTWNELR
jgi:hypothetical protein